MKWLPHWIYYVINMYIFHKQVHFAYINTHQVFLSTANAIGIVNTCCSIATVWNHLTSKPQNCFCSFLLSCRKLYSMITLLYEKLVGWWSNKNTALTMVYGDNDWNSYTLKSTSKCTEWAPAAFFQLSVILVSDRSNTAKWCKCMCLHCLSLSCVTE